VISGSADSTIKMWNLETGMCEKTLTSHGDAISALLGWEKYLVSGSWDKTVKVIIIVQ
jgi:WD40 repeat protein